MHYNDAIVPGHVCAAANVSVCCTRSGDRSLPTTETVTRSGKTFFVVVAVLPAALLRKFAIGRKLE